MAARRPGREPNGSNAEILVAAKGFDSTGSKLSDALRCGAGDRGDGGREAPRQFVMAVIGWKTGLADLRSIHEFWVNQQIDGMYTLATLDQTWDDLEDSVRLRDLRQGGICVCGAWLFRRQSP